MFDLPLFQGACMEVTVHLFSTLREGRFETSKIRLREEGKISDLLDLLGISREEVGVAVVDKQDADFDRELREGNVVTLIPIIGGG